MATYTTTTTNDEEPAPPPSLPPASSDETSINERRKKSFEYTKSFLLGKEIKTTLSDGRKLTGKFICIDRLKNLILTNVIEERYIDPSDYRYRVDGDNENNDDNDNGNNSVERRIRVERHISQAMIPGSRLVKAEISQSI